MDERTLRALAGKSMAAMLLILVFSAVFTGYNNMPIYANEGARWPMAENAVSGTDMQLDGLFENVYGNMGAGARTDGIKGKLLTIRKGSGKSHKFILEDLYMEKKLRISIFGLEEKSIEKQDIVFEGSGEEPLQSTRISYQYNPDSFFYTAILELQMDHIYVPYVYEAEESICISLLDPRQVYEKIIVVDAGHGGNDIGTYSKDMKYFEKDLNLSILLCLKELLDKEDIKVYYTRLTDEKVYLNPRLSLANDLKADMFISIHCNSSSRSAAQGGEVLYSTKNQKKLSIKSDKLAEIFLEELAAASGLEKRGTVNGDDIYIIGNAKVPAVLIEVGFMSNKEDLRFLKETANQKLAAEGIYKGIIKAYKALEENEAEGA